MRVLVKVLFLSIILLFSCQSEEIATDEVLDVISEESSANNEYTYSPNLNPDTPPDFEEYFFSTIDGSEFNAYDPEFIEGYLKVNPISGVVSFYFFAYPTADSDQVFGFQLCFYNGMAKYHTGDGLTNSWCYFWDDNTVWYSDIKLEGDPAMGTYTLTNATAEIIEGEFEITAYNSDDQNSLIEISGKFGVFLEDPPES